MNGLKRTMNGASEMAEKTGKVGGQWNNKNARKHSVYLQKWDKRTKDARMLLEVEAGLANAMGGDPSEQQILLIQPTAVIAFRLHLLTTHFLKLLKEAQDSGKKYAQLRIPPHLEKQFLTWNNALRANLQVLGMERRTKNVTDLKDYLAENYGGETG
jgi:hypothetical protein